MKNTYLVPVVLGVVLLASALLLGACSGKKTETTPTKPQDSSPVSSTTPLEPSSWGDYFERVGGKELAFAQGVAAEQPTRLELTWYSVGGGRTRVYIDAETIIGAFNALAVLDVAGEARTVTTDDDSVWRFVMADGAEYSFGFNSGNAGLDKSYYKLENTAAFSQYEHRLRSEYDEGYGNISAAQLASLEIGETWWGDVYGMLGEPLGFEHNDEYTAITVIYATEDGQAAVLGLESPDGKSNHYQLSSVQIQAMPEELMY